VCVFEQVNACNSQTFHTHNPPRAHARTCVHTHECIMRVHGRPHVQGLGRHSPLLSAFCPGPLLEQGQISPCSDPLKPAPAQDRPSHMRTCLHIHAHDAYTHMSAHSSPRGFARRIRRAAHRGRNRRKRIMRPRHAVMHTPASPARIRSAKSLQIGTFRFQDQ